MKETNNSFVFNITTLDKSEKSWDSMYIFSLIIIIIIKMYVKYFIIIYGMIWKYRYVLWKIVRRLNQRFDILPIDLIAVEFSHICLIDVPPQRSEPSGIIIVRPRRTFKVQVPIGQAISANGNTLRISAFDEYGRVLARSNMHPLRY